MTGIGAVEGSLDKQWDMDIETADGCYQKVK